MNRSSTLRRIIGTAGILACFQTAVPIVVAGSQADTSAGEFARLGPDAEVPLPPGWMLLSDSTGFPAQMVYQNDSAEILFFRSRISGKDMITNESELRTSVDLVVDEVIYSLPEGQLLTTTGFYDGFRTGFTLEFLSVDSISGIPLEHSLRGIIYRHADDYQTLFTVWGKAARSGYADVKTAITTVQEGFAYRGDFEDEVFEPTPMSYWPLVLVVMAIIGVMLLRPPWRRAKNNPETVHTFSES